MTAALRVLSVATLFPSPGQRGNFGGFVARQFEALMARGDIDLTVFNPSPGWPLLSAERVPDMSRGYPVFRPGYLKIPRLGWRWNPALIARSVLPLARQLHAAQPFDLVDAQFFYPDGPAAARIAAALGLPLSIKARGSDIHYWGTLPLARRKMLAAAEQSGGMLAVSEALRADMVLLGMDASRIAVHYTGLDHAMFHPRDRGQARQDFVCAAESAIPADGALLASVGNLVAIKGHAWVIRALGEVPGARLAIAGCGEERASLQALAAQCGVAERVHFLGGLDPARIALLLGAADAMVLASEREGLANAWIEALACGAPLIITDVGGAREVVRSSAAGLLTAREPAAIAAAMRKTISSPPDRSAVAAEAARFSWAANAAQLADHYRLLAGSGPSRASRS